MNSRKLATIEQTTETEETIGQNQFPSNVKLHPKITYGAFVMNYIEELQAEINRLSKENVYLQSDEYLNKIFPTNYIQELKDKVNTLEKENESLKKENASKLNIKATYAGVIDPRATYAGELDPNKNYGGYNRSYVKELQDELTKVTEENFYLKSEEYQKKVSSKYSQEQKSKTSTGTKDQELQKQLTKLKEENLYLKSEEYQKKLANKYSQEQKSKTSTEKKELQEQLTKLTEENLYLKSEEYQKKFSSKYSQEKKLMVRKIQNLSQIIMELSYDSLEREGILAQLKQALDTKNDNSNIKTTQGSFDQSSANSLV